MENKPDSREPATSSTPLLGALSLRAKLILANMLIIILAIVGTGYYVYSRTKLANTFLVNQLDQNVLQQARDQLSSTSAAQAKSLNDFYVQMRRDITTIAATSSSLLSQEATFSNLNYWDATQALTRLPNGSWDNSNSEASSIFIPAKIDLTEPLALELDAIKQLDITVPPVLKKNADTVAIYFGGQSGETLYYPNIDLATIVPPDFDVTSRPWYVNASTAQNPNRTAVWSEPYLDAALHGLVVTTSAPVYDASGTFRGVVAMDIQLNRITDLVSNIQIGKSGYAMLVDRNNRLIGMPLAGYSDLGITSTDIPLGEVLDPAKLPGDQSGLFDVLSLTAAGQSGVEALTINGTSRLVAYNPIPEVGYSLVVIAPSSELLANANTAEQRNAAETQSTFISSLILVFAILVVAIAATLWISNSLTSPLVTLTRVAKEITQGNLSTEAKIRSRDEVGILAAAINSMTSSLKHMIESLEQQVSDRTTDLVRKTLYLQSAALVAHEAAEIEDLNTLLTHTAEMISRRFGFYHVGIFLLDDTGDHAVLQAASSEGGQRMLARGHSLDVGLQGIVGAAAYQKRPRVVMEVDTDKDYYKNPDLPMTRSEAAIPLTAHGQVLGILDIQSTEVSAFHQDDIDVLYTMADQIGLAIRNAKSLTESQTAIQKMEVATAQNLQRIWRERIRGASMAYQYSPIGISSTNKPENPPQEKDGNNPLHIPISLRGQRIGTIRLQRKKTGLWSETDRALAIEVANQVGLALENARLLDEAQQRAALEQSLSQLTAHLSSSLDPDLILQTVVRELYHLPNVEEVSVFVSSQESANDEPDESKE